MPPKERLARAATLPAAAAARGDRPLAAAPAVLDDVVRLATGGRKSLADLGLKATERPAAPRPVTPLGFPLGPPRRRAPAACRAAAGDDEEVPVTPIGATDEAESQEAQEAWDPSNDDPDGELESDHVGSPFGSPASPIVIDDASQDGNTTYYN